MYRIRKWLLHIQRYDNNTLYGLYMLYTIAIVKDYLVKYFKYVVNENA